MVEKSVIIFVFFVIVAEYIHLKRMQKISPLIFGNIERRIWTKAAIFIRIISIGFLSWGFIYLIFMEPRIIGGSVSKSKEHRHIVIVLDVSPSMKIKDAGKNGNITRAQKASKAIRSIINRLALEQVKFSIIAVYTKALRVVYEVKDLTVIYNIIDDLPMSYAFDNGKTDLVLGIKEAFILAKDWKKNSTMILLASDGDSISDTGIPSVPISIKRFVIIGVGNEKYGQFIHGHISRQNVKVLRSLARRLKGRYENCNEKNIPSIYLHDFHISKTPVKKIVWDKRLLAILSIIIGAALLSFLPLCLHLFGHNWKKRLQKGSFVSKE